jgi:electron transfer flavoprotein beta subunit
LKIVVCIKQVPDTSEVRINPETNTLIRDGVPSIINPYDLHALEAGLRIRELVGGSITALTMGPPQAEIALREALSLGIDHAVLLTDRAFSGADTWATAYALSKAIEYLGADIILCGKQAIDGDTAQVGPEIAAFLNIPHIAYIRKIDSVKESGIVVQRLMDDGVVKEINVPRMPSLKGKMAARKAEIQNMTASDIQAGDDDIGLKGSPTQVKNIFAPETIKDRKMIDGTSEEKIAALLQELKALGCL